MKLLKIVVDGLPLYKKRLDICFYAQQRVSEEQRDYLYPLFSSVFLNTTNVFAGINASGKTSTLKVILLALRLLSGTPINSKTEKNILGRANNVTFSTYFYSEKTSEIGKLETVISFKNIDNDGQPVYKISSEKLWSKRLTSSTVRKNMLDFGDVKPLLDRNDPKKKELLSFLADDNSIIISKIKTDEEDVLHVLETLALTNFNGLPFIGEISKEIITYLDPTIEYLNFENDERHSIRLKFKGQDELVLFNPLELAKYLSSGTIKGIWIFTFALYTFQKGGYLLVDELENHFNKEIVCTIIRFFKDNKFNKNGGTLIYSTHYPELLDENERNDNIFITNNYGGITVENLSTILKRNDIKKSDIYQSGELTGTAPSYDSYIALKTKFESMITSHHEEQ